MRLTPDVVAEAPQNLNCVGDRELVLRNLAIPAVENLATARNLFDAIDLTGNVIEVLGAECFPPFPRLSVLYVGSNQVRTITRGLADSLPNLRTLVLTSNNIESVERLNVPELARFKSLETLSLAGNPVARDTSLRLLLVHQIPSLRFIDFVRVTRADRLAAGEKHGPPPEGLGNGVKEKGKGKGKGKRKRKGKGKSANAEGVKTFDVGTLGDDDDGQAEGSGGDRSLKRGKAVGSKKGSKGPALSAEIVDSVKAAIVKATSIDEVMALQKALQSGDIDAVKHLVK